MWLHVLTNRKVAIYSDGDNIIIIIIIKVFGLRLVFTLVMLVLRWSRWYFVGSVGDSLVALVIRWLLSPR